MEAARLQSDAASTDAANPDDEGQAMFADVDLGYAGARRPHGQVRSVWLIVFLCSVSLPPALL